MRFFLDAGGNEGRGCSSKAVVRSESRDSGFRSTVVVAKEQGRLSGYGMFV